ncbi:MAG: NAD-dependent epimerase/dehydratase family protein [Longimicrobiales bacterium]
MTTNRRQFIRATAAAGGALSLGLTPEFARGEVASRRGAQRKIRLLILGGTGFIGPHQVRYALERGHDVTIFNRGSHPDMFPGVTELIGDRETAELASLEGKTWDAVIDNSASRGNAPEWVRDTATLLRDQAEQYLFISTRSVYSDLSMVPATVDAPTHSPETMPDWSPGENRPYGLAKAEAERAAWAAFGRERVTIVRPGLIVGPDDETDRFTYWPVRIERGGEILAPGRPLEDRIQIIDVRDLCEWCIRLCEARTYGTFMGIGPENGRSIAEVLYGIAAVTTAPLSWTWVPLEFLQQHDVRPYSGMPVWMPPTPGREGFARFDLSREVAAGLTFRPLAVTARDTLEYHHSRPAERQQQLESGITAAKEAEVLRAWHAANGI